MFSKFLVGVFAVLSMSGCSLVDGNSDYGCPGMPGGVQCRSAREVYHLTNGRSHITDTDLAAKDANAGGSRRAARDPIAEIPAAVPGSVPVAYSDADQVPIRTQAKVMRVWIAPYEDQNGDLVMPGHLFTEIDPRRWSVASPAAVLAANNVYRPLEAKASPAQGIASAPSAGKETAK